MIKSYRTFLMELGSELVEAMGECENLEWHHAEVTSDHFRHYNRLCTWAWEIAERLSYYDHYKAKRPAWVQRDVPAAEWQQTLTGVVHEAPGLQSGSEC